MITKKFGWIPDIPDQRDFKYSAPKKSAKKRLYRVDLRPYMPPIYEQGYLGSCVSQAVGACLQFLQMKQKRSWFVPSRLFLYYNARLIDGTTNYDAGSYIRSGIKAANRYGGPEETLWKYNINNFKIKPPINVYTEGLTHQALKYERVAQNAIQIETRISQGYPIILGIAVYESFLSNKVAKSGYVKLPGKREVMVGGHAIVLVGYNQTQRRFICRNSWGGGWGLGGNFTIPYEYILNNNLTEDLWTIQLVE